MSSFDTYYHSTMQKHRFVLALAGFWHVLKLAVGYYILMSFLPAQTSQAEKLLFLWFGSPALIAASLFFFPYFKPERYKACIDPARLTLGLDAVVACGILLFTIISRLAGWEIRPTDESNPVILILCFTAIIIDCAILLLLSRNRFAVSQEN